VRVEHLPRDVFIREVFVPAYAPSQHVGFIGPTQLAGKTYTAFQLLSHVATPEAPATCLVAKPRDSEVDRWKEQIGFQESDNWPPRRRFFSPKPPGHVIWPRHGTDAARNEEHMKDVFGRAIMHNYMHGPGITFADELYRLSQIGLHKEIDAMLTGGAGMRAALWYGTQKPSGTARVSVSTFAYNSPTWLFLSYDPDERNRRRYQEIGGVDPKLIEAATVSLPRFNWFVFHRDSGGVCTIGA
jgi:hypothetical protein